jgi:hypothetical protein
VRDKHYGTRNSLPARIYYLLCLVCAFVRLCVCGNGCVHVLTCWCVWYDMLLVLIIITCMRFVRMSMLCCVCRAFIICEALLRVCVLKVRVCVLKVRVACCVLRGCVFAVLSVRLCVVC